MMEHSLLVPLWGPFVVEVLRNLRIGHSVLVVNNHPENHYTYSQVHYVHSSDQYWMRKKGWTHSQSHDWLQILGDNDGQEEDNLVGKQPLEDNPAEVGSQPAEADSWSWVESLLH